MSVGVADSRFELFVDEVRVKYAADERAPDIKPAAWQVGRLKGMGQAAAPSIKFSRPAGVVQAATRHGPFKIVVAGGPDVFMCARYEELANVEARIHAKNWSELDCIWTGLLAAIHNVFGADGSPGSYDHVSEGDDDPMPDFVKGNQLLVQSFVWRITIPHAFGTMTEIDTVLGSSEFHDINPAPGTAGPSTVQT